MIFNEASPFEHVYELLKGVVSLFRITADGRRQIIGFRYPGQMFGLGVGGCHVYAAEGVTGIPVCQHPQASLDRVLEEQPDMARRLLATMGSELVAAQEQILLLERKTAAERLATFLLHLSIAQAARGEDPLALHLPMSRTDIGDYLGLTIETVSRMFTRLQRSGVLDLLQCRAVAIRDVKRLSDLAEVEESRSMG